MNEGQEGQEKCNKILAGCPTCPTFTVPGLCRAGSGLPVLTSTSVFIVVGMTSNWCAFTSHFRCGEWACV